jgi:hypothetical protein
MPRLKTAPVPRPVRSWPEAQLILKNDFEDEERDCAQQPGQQVNPTETRQPHCAAAEAGHGYVEDWQQCSLLSICDLSSTICLRQ